MSDSINTVRVAIYARTASKEGNPSPSIVRQIEQMGTYAAARDWKIQEETIFVDDGYSGLVLDRPALNQVRTLVQARQLDLILVTDPSRLTRHFADMVTLYTELASFSCGVETPEGGPLRLSELIGLLTARMQLPLARRQVTRARALPTAPASSAQPGAGSAE